MAVPRVISGSRTKNLSMRGYDDDSEGYMALALALINGVGADDAFRIMAGEVSRAQTKSLILDAKAMDAAGYTRKEIATAIGKSTSYVSRLLSMDETEISSGRGSGHRRKDIKDGVRMKKMRMAGMTWKSIGDEFGVKPSSVLMFVKRYEDEINRLIEEENYDDSRR